jgi:hypothetical protein
MSARPYAAADAARAEAAEFKSKYDQAMSKQSESVAEAAADSYLAGYNMSKQSGTVVEESHLVGYTMSKQSETTMEEEESPASARSWLEAEEEAGAYTRPVFSST